MERRFVLKSLVAGASAAMIPGFSMASKPGKKHLITLSFDDGFKKSSLETVKIFDKHGLKACLNVVAARTGAKDFLPPDEWHRHPVGDWDLWNELQNRGHEIMPHGLVHADLSGVPFRAAQNMILSCMNIFRDKLRGFDPSKAVFNFPYNRATPEIEEWLRGEAMAIRRGGPSINPLPHKGQFLLTCTTGGKWNIDNHLNNEVDKLLNQPEGWLIYNTHGIDEEGWGPVSARALDLLLYKLKDLDSVEVVNPGQVLNKINSGF